MILPAHLSVLIFEPQNFGRFKHSRSDQSESQLAVRQLRSYRPIRATRIRRRTRTCTFPCNPVTAASHNFFGFYIASRPIRAAERSLLRTLARRDRLPFYSKAIRYVNTQIRKYAKQASRQSLAPLSNSILRAQADGSPPQHPNIPRHTNLPATSAIRFAYSPTSAL